MAIRIVEAYETSDGERHATMAAAELHDAERAVVHAMEETGLVGGLEAAFLRYTLFDAAEILGPLLVKLAKKQAAAGE